MNMENKSLYCSLNSTLYRSHDIESFSLVRYHKAFNFKDKTDFTFSIWFTTRPKFHFVSQFKSLWCNTIWGSCSKKCTGKCIWCLIQWSHIFRLIAKLPRSTFDITSEQKIGGSERAEVQVPGQICIIKEFLDLFFRPVATTGFLRSRTSRISNGCDLSIYNILCATCHYQENAK